MKVNSIIITILVLLASFQNSQAQFVPFNTYYGYEFYNYVVANYPACVNTATEELDTTCADLFNVETMDLSSMGQMMAFKEIRYFKNLDTLIIPPFYQDNPMVVLPPALRYLDCSGNFNLSGFTSLPSTLTYLNCDNSSIQSLPSLPPSLIYLSLNSTAGMTSIPALPATLRYLSCNNELNLTALPSLPDRLLYLNCESSSIGILPALPSSLRYLNCHNCNLNSMPALPDSLAFLSFRHNNISTLPSLPDSLITLICNYNNLTVLPVLPDLLKYLDCNWNNISCLPMLPNSLTTLYIPSQVECIPNIPQSMDINDVPAQLCTSPDGCSILTAVSSPAGQSISIYPNPSSDLINVKGLISGDHYSVYNNMGSLIYSGSDNNPQISLSDFSSGIYTLMVIRKDRGVESHQFVKQ